MLTFYYMYNVYLYAYSLKRSHNSGFLGNLFKYMLANNSNFKHHVGQYYSSTTLCGPGLAPSQLYMDCIVY